MTRSVSARRQGLRKNDAQVTLFPFLAVLICTMGALIVLLVVLVQQAKVQANQVAEERRAQAAQTSHVQEELRIEQETYEWRLEVLETQRAEISQRLADQRLRLSHVEDHFRRLKAELQDMVEQAAELERVLQGGGNDVEAAQADLARMQQAIEAARRRLADVRAAMDEKPRSFALIPYVGPSGTRRRPIYIECRADRVILQPEGVALVARDFDGPLGPGNPLDAALRATREYLAQTGGVEQHGEPYPLMVVRPQGSRSYAAARAAIESWDDEFGYELIDDNLVLEYPTPDPNLRELLQMAVDEARRRQEILRAAQPNRFEASAVAGFQATPRHGGFAPIGDVGGDVGGPSSGAELGFRGGAASGGSHNARENGPDDQRRGGEGNGQGNGDTPKRVQAGEGNGAVNVPGGVVGGTSATGQTAPSSPDTTFAASRGSDWGLRDAANGATPYTRPIAVQCFPDRLVVVPERATDQAPVVISLEGPTRAGIDPFVQAIWKRMDSWGLAGARAYWKPVLKVEVAPGAEGRFADMQRLLDDSGLVIERKTP